MPAMHDFQFGKTSRLAFFFLLVFYSNPCLPDRNPSFFFFFFIIAHYWCHWLWREIGLRFLVLIHFVSFFIYFLFFAPYPWDTDTD